MTPTATNKVAKFNKVVTLARRPGTEGEGKAAWAAAERLWHACAGVRAATSQLEGIEYGFGYELVDALVALWDGKANTLPASVTRTFLHWELTYYGAKAIRQARRILRERKAAQWENGRFVGPVNEHGNSELKMLNCLDWPLARAYRAACIAEYGDVPDNWAAK